MKKRRFIDLSVAIEPGLPSDPEMMIPKIQYVTHDEGAEMMEAFFPGLKKEDLPGGKGWTVELVELSTHSGTHLDAPWHYSPTMNKGKRAWTIDEVPLDWCMGDGWSWTFDTSRTVTRSHPLTSKRPSGRSTTPPNRAISC